MMAFGLSSVMLCVGMFLRAKISILCKMLVPSSVISGVIGILFMNSISVIGIDMGINSEMDTEIANNLFMISFISISLTNTFKENNSTKEVMKGAVGLRLV